MKIKRIGEACLKISVSPKKGKKVNVLIDPFNGRLESKIDILLLSHAGKEPVRVKGNPFLIKGPGEYEIQGVFIRGLAAQKTNSKTQADLTIYTIESRRMRVCYLGHFGQKELSAEQLEIIGSVDVLIVPIAGILSSKEIQKVISQLEPKLIVPIEYSQTNLKTQLREFLKEMGAKKIKEENKINVKRKELKEEEARIIVLKPA
jgi:L-ascorbate metabolism protein UlaG (beta-lactamase superfamily)